VTIRPAVAADVPAVAALERDNLGVDAWPEGLVAEGLLGNLPTVSCLVAEVDAEDGPRVVGHAVASVVADIAELQRIAVDPSCRRRGIASSLLAAVVEHASGLGCDRLLLEVREDNHVACAFYAARGFIELDRRPSYYADGTTAVVLLRELS